MSADMDRVTSVLSSLVLLVCLSRQVLAQEPPCPGYMNQTCTSCVGNKLLIQCPVGEIITGFIKGGFRHSSDSTSCGHQPEDCMAVTVFLVGAIAECMWKQRSCDLTLSSADFSIGFVCSGSPSYLMASSLSCQPESSLHTLCDSDSEHQLLSFDLDSSGHILSPGFPKPYAQVADLWQGHCPVTLATAQRLGIRLQSVYMDLRGRTNAQCEEDYIQLSWNLDGSTESHDVRHCGQEPLDMHIDASQVVMTFVFRDFQQTNQGFSLVYSAYVIPEGSTESSTEVLMTTPQRDGSSTSEAASPTTSSMSTDPSQTTVYIILGVTLTLLLVLILVSVTLCCRHRDAYSPPKLQPCIKTATLPDTASSDSYLTSGYV